MKEPRNTKPTADRRSPAQGKASNLAKAQQEEMKKNQPANQPQTKGNKAQDKRDMGY